MDEMLHRLRRLHGRLYGERFKAEFFPCRSADDSDTLYISSVDRLWGVVFYKPAKGWRSRCKAYRHPSWTALHHTRGQWRINQSGDSDACVAVHVPAAIRRDLGIPCYPLLP